MSGTSADGIDAAIIRVQGQGLEMRVRLVHHHHVPFGAKLRRRLLAIMAPAETTTQEVARLHSLLGEAFANAAIEAMKQVGRAEQPCVIGLSGQTVCHLPNDRGSTTVTLQLGSPAIVAAMTGRPVVGDFRQSDVAVGGQGAPLVPWTDWVLFHDDRYSRAIQNIGGIGNVTWIPAGQGPEGVVAFDTGPGNMVIDGIVARATDQRRRMDRDGRMAACGRVIEPILAEWLKHPFLRQDWPRTAGREEFGASFVDRYWNKLGRASKRPEDWVATATAFTARSIADSYHRFLLRAADGRCARRHIYSRARRNSMERGDIGQPVQVVLVGGGSYNSTLRGMLQAELSGLPGVELSDVSFVSIERFGISAQAKEAVSFAMLAVARLDGTASNLPAVTGARFAASLGSIYL